MTEGRSPAKSSRGVQPAGQHAAGADDAGQPRPPRPTTVDAADRQGAAEFQATLSDEDIEASYRRALASLKPNAPLCDAIIPADARPSGGIGSTDVGDVSWVVPTVQARGATYAVGTPGIPGS